MTEVCRAFVWMEGFEGFTDALPSCVDASLVGLSHESFEFCEHHLDRVQVGGVGWQEEEAGPGSSDSVSGWPTLMAAEIVEDDDVSGRQCRDQGLFQPGGEGSPIDRTINNAGSHDPVAAQACDEGQGLPLAKGHRGQQRRAAWRPAPRAGHVGLHPGFINEDKPLRIKPVLMGFPARPEPRHLGTMDLAGHQSFF